MHNNQYASSERSSTMRPVPTCPVCAEGIRHSCIENRHIEVCHQCTVTWSPCKQYQCPNCFPTPGEGAIWDHYYMVDWFLDYQGRVPVSEDDDETISDSGSHKGAVDSDVLQAAHALIELNTEWRQAEINRPMGVASLKYSKASQAEIRHALECIQNPRNRRTRKGKTPAAILARDRELAIEKYVKLIYKTVPPGENEVETAVKRIQVLMSEPRNELTDAVKAIRVVKDECQNLTGHDYWARY